MEMILKTDEGPDFKVDSDNRLGYAEIVCGRTHKVVGRVAVYHGGRNLLVYVTDKRRKEGQNRIAYLFSRSSSASEILAKCGGGAALKEALRQSEIIDESVQVHMARAVVE